MLPPPQALPYIRGRERLLTMQQVAQRLNISKSHAYRLKDEGQLGPVVMIGASVRVYESGVDAFIRERQESQDQ